MKKKAKSLFFFSNYLQSAKGLKARIIMTKKILVFNLLNTWM